MPSTMPAPLPVPPPRPPPAPALSSTPSSSKISPRPPSSPSLSSSSSSCSPAPHPPPCPPPSVPPAPASWSSLPPCCCSPHACLNIAVLGHIDCGKTALVRALTEVKSTAALDKAPQSRQRGMTLDLGFTAFYLPLQRPSTAAAAAAAQSATAAAACLAAPRGAPPEKQEGEETAAAEEENRADTGKEVRTAQQQVVGKEASPDDPDCLVGCTYTALGKSAGSTTASAATAAAPPRIRSVRDASSSSSFQSFSSSSRSSSSSSHFSSPGPHPPPSTSSATPSLRASSSAAAPATSLLHADFFPPTAAQVCLVDCPGHASLLRTIIGGVHIVHGVLLVIDTTKGIQSQTAECIVVAELLTCELIIVLNKIDLIPAESRDEKVALVSKKLRATFAQTAFGAGIRIVAVAALPGAAEQDAARGASPWGVEEVKRALRDMLLRKQSSPCCCCTCCSSGPAAAAGIATSSQREAQDQEENSSNEGKQDEVEGAPETRGKEAKEGKREERNEDAKEVEKKAETQENGERNKGQTLWSKDELLQPSTPKTAAARQGGEAGAKEDEEHKDREKRDRGRTDTASQLEKSGTRAREREKEQEKGHSRSAHAAAADRDAKTLESPNAAGADEKQRTSPLPKITSISQQEPSPPSSKLPVPQQEPHFFVDCLWNAQRCAACPCCRQRHASCCDGIESARIDEDPLHNSLSSVRSRNSSSRWDVTVRGTRSSNPRGTFYMAFDHCFALKGKGTIFTGTVLAGQVRMGDVVAVLPASKTGSSSSVNDSSSNRSGNARTSSSSSHRTSSSSSSRSVGSTKGSSGVISGKVRSLQTFHRDVQVAVRGQRVAVGLVGVDAAAFERGALCDPQNVPKRAIGCCAVVQKIRFFKPEIPSGGLFHCTIGHTTVMCAARFFGVFPADQPSLKQLSSSRSSPFSFTRSSASSSSASSSCCSSSSSSSSSTAFRPLSPSCSSCVAVAAAAAPHQEERAPFSAVAPGRVTTSLSVGRVVPSSGRSSCGHRCPSPSASSCSSSSSKAAAFGRRERRWPEALDEEAVYRCLDRLEDCGDTQQLTQKTKMNKNSKISTRMKNSSAKQAISESSSIHRNTCKSSCSSQGASKKTMNHVAHVCTSSLPEEERHEEEQEEEEETPVLHVAVLFFEKPVTVPAGSLFICSKLDMEPSTAACRLAFFGRLLLTLDAKDAAAACQPSIPSSPFRWSSSSLLSRTIPKTLWLHPVLRRLKLLKRKKKLGTVERFLFSPPCKCPVEHLPHTSNRNISADASPSLSCPALPYSSFSSPPSSASSSQTSQGYSKECVTYSLIGRGLFKSSQHVNAFIGFCVSVLPPAITNYTAIAATAASGGAGEVAPAVADGAVHAARCRPCPLQTAAAETCKGSEEDEEEEEEGEQPPSADRDSNGASAYVCFSGLLGRIEKPFGNKGKFVVQLSGPVSCGAVRRLLPRGNVSCTEKGGQHDSLFTVVLDYEKQVFDGTNKFSQQCSRLRGTPEIVKSRAENFST